MKMRLLAVLAALTLMLGVGLTAPAVAKDTSWGRQAAGAHQAKDTSWGKVKARKALGTDVSHAADDSGWADPIHVRCNDGKHLYLVRGQSTVFDSRGSCTLSGVAVIIVPAGHTVYCKNALPPYQNRYYYVGSTEVPSAASLKCYDQKAL